MEVSAAGWRVQCEGSALTSLFENPLRCTVRSEHEKRMPQHNKIALCHSVGTVLQFIIYSLNSWCVPDAPKCWDGVCE